MQCIKRFLQCSLSWGQILEAVRLYSFLLYVMGGFHLWQENYWESERWYEGSSPQNKWNHIYLEIGFRHIYTGSIISTPHCMPKLILTTCSQLWIYVAHTRLWVGNTFNNLHVFSNEHHRCMWLYILDHNYHGYWPHSTHKVTSLLLGQNVTQRVQVWYSMQGSDECSLRVWNLRVLEICYDMFHREGRVEGSSTWYN